MHATSYVRICTPLPHRIRCHPKAGGKGWSQGILNLESCPNTVKGTVYNVAKHILLAKHGPK